MNRIASNMWHKKGSEIVVALHRAPASGDRKVAGNSALGAKHPPRGCNTPELTLRGTIRPNHKSPTSILNLARTTTKNWPISRN